MAENIIAAIDETAGNHILVAAEGAVNPTLHDAGSVPLGGLTITHSETASLSGGMVAFAPPSTIKVSNCRMDYTIKLTFAFDLNSILPHGCLPQVCFHIPFDGTICTPKICVSWPTITIPVTFSDHVTFSADFGVSVTQSGGNLVVEATILAVPTLNLGAATTALIAAIGSAVSAALLVVPLIGPFLAVAAAGITAAFTVAAITGLLGPILTAFLSGLKLPLFQHSRTLVLLAASGPTDPEVDVQIQLLTARVESTDKNELVLAATI
jgi:hypothetical protein